MTEVSAPGLGEIQNRVSLIGEAPAFRWAIRQLPAIAKSDAPVLITGETGTGKELVAWTIHSLSRRAGFPFVAMNCGALPDTLLESELFGHERGAFTDTHRQRSGLIAQAEKGTLFMDEIDALSPKAQVTLLRVLQEHRFRPLGATHEERANLRIITATNANLKEALRGSSLRSDLFYRLCVLPVHLPPLRERKEDILPLAAHFLATKTPPDCSIPRLTPGACAALLAFEWPGNVRELENRIVRAIHLSPTEAIRTEDLGFEELSATESARTATATSLMKNVKHQVVAAFEREYLVRLLRVHEGNVSRAAREAGKERRELGRLLKKYRIDPKHPVMDADAGCLQVRSV